MREESVSFPNRHDAIHHHRRWLHRKVQEAIKAAPMKEQFAKLLEEVFEPSPFGHGGNTVLDHSVRKAMQVRRRLLSSLATTNAYRRRERE